jgi:PHD/YefM family antitoxin component YafN of YafNO toxin-antitoxin module
MTRTRSQFQSSDVSRQPLRVFDAAENGPVAVTRRDGEDLVLMSKRDADAIDWLLTFAAQVLAVSVEHKDGLSDRLASLYPWMLALGNADREQCAADILRASQAALATHQPQLAVAEVTSWRETAMAVADGVAGEHTEWLEEPETVERPE